MLMDSANDERKIIKFPTAYDLNATPYAEKDFSGFLKEACMRHSMVMRGLKVSKAIIVGDVAVGKTSLVNRYCHQTFDRNYKATIGVDFEVEQFNILNIPFSLQIWDTAGQERFKSIASSYYRGAHVVVIAFDLTNPMSLSHCLSWKNEAMNAISGCPHLFLVGTKQDLLRSRRSFNEMKYHAVKMAFELEAELWCVSSQTGEGVENLFCRIAALTFNSSVLQSQTNVLPLTVGSDLVRTSEQLDGRLQWETNPHCTYGQF